MAKLKKLGQNLVICYQMVSYNPSSQIKIIITNNNNNNNDNNK